MKNKKIVSLIALFLVVSAVAALPAYACGLKGDKGGHTEDSGTE